MRSTRRSKHLARLSNDTSRVAILLLQFIIVSIDLEFIKDIVMGSAIRTIVLLNYLSVLSCEHAHEFVVDVVAA